MAHSLPGAYYGAMIGQMACTNPHRSARRAGFALAFALALAACGRAPAPLDNQAYVGQRQWNPALAAALDDGAKTFRGYRVLASEIRAGRLDLYTPDLATLQRVGTPVTVVVRLGAAGVDEAEVAAGRIVALVGKWRAAGVHVTGIEIDPDDGPAQAGVCAALLRALRAGRSRDLALGLAVAPHWLDAQAFAPVAAQADETVLPMLDAHAPGAFDAVAQWRRINAYGDAARAPFRVAIPAPEQPEDDAGPAARSAGASAAHAGQAQAGQVAQVLRALERQRPRQLAGFVWPGVGDDARAWSPATVRALVAGESLRPVVKVTFDPTADGARQLVLDNIGALEAPAPKMVVIAAYDCENGEAFDGFRLERMGDDWRFVADGAGAIGAGRSLRVGWLRCERIAGLKIDDDR